MGPATNLREVIVRLRSGETSATQLLQRALARIESEGGDADQAVFTQLFTRSARAQAEAADTLHRAGAPDSTLMGAFISIKDLFDVAGYPTHAGSQVLAPAPPADTDATVVARLRGAGAVLVGHTNMTEFAYSGVGLNPHYGTPRNPYDQERIAGGSSSGAAVSVAQGMAAAALGTDTGGSIRIPAALCGLAGFKPSHGRIPLNGAIPLSPSLDSVGPIAPSIGDCALLDAVLSAQPAPPLPDYATRGLNLALPQTFVLDGLDSAVSSAFFGAIDKLRSAGVTVTETAFANLAELPALLAGGGICAAQAYRWHRHLLSQHAGRYDPRVKTRLLQGETMSAADYLDLTDERARQCRAMDSAMRQFDAVVLPTTARVAARVSDFEQDADYSRLNALFLRNTSIANQLDLCAATLPCQAPGDLPVGFMVMGRHGDDAQTLAIAKRLEALLY